MSLNQPRARSLPAYRLPNLVRHRPRENFVEALGVALYVRPREIFVHGEMLFLRGGEPHRALFEKVVALLNPDPRVELREAGADLRRAFAQQFVLDRHLPTLRPFEIS